MTQLIQVVQVGEKKKAQPLATNKFDVDMSEGPSISDSNGVATLEGKLKLNT